MRMQGNKNVKTFLVLTAKANEKTALLERSKTE